MKTIYHDTMMRRKIRRYAGIRPRWRVPKRIVNLMPMSAEERRIIVEAWRACYGDQSAIMIFGVAPLIAYADCSERL